MQRLIKVTAEDIRKGTRACRNVCPIARALLREFPEARDAGVEYKYDPIYRRVALCVAKYPEWVQEFTVANRDVELQLHDFIRRFDNGETVEPFEFEVFWEDDWEDDWDDDAAWTTSTHFVTEMVFVGSCGLPKRIIVWNSLS